jgi:hypothetical protein
LYLLPFLLAVVGCFFGICLFNVICKTVYSPQHPSHTLKSPIAMLAVCYWLDTRSKFIIPTMVCGLIGAFIGSKIGFALM